MKRNMRLTKRVYWFRSCGESARLPGSEAVCGVTEEAQVRLPCSGNIKCQVLWPWTSINAAVTHGNPISQLTKA